MAAPKKKIYNKNLKNAGKFKSPLAWGLKKINKFRAFKDKTLIKLS